MRTDYLARRPTYIARRRREPRIRGRRALRVGRYVVAAVAGLAALSGGAALAALTARRGNPSDSARRFEAETHLTASPDAVWRALTDLQAFPQWNPFIVRATGQLRRDERITIHLRVGGPFPTRLRPRLTSVEPARELRWLWVTVHRRLFAADRYFILEPQGGGTHFVQGEAWSGLLAPLPAALGMQRQLLERIRAMSAALEARLAPVAEPEPSTR